MNLLKYKEAMDEIELDTVEMKERIYGTINKKRTIPYKKLVAVFAALVLVLLNFSDLPFISLVEPSFTMTVYAAEEMVGELNNEFLTIKTEINPVNTGAFYDELGNYLRAEINVNVTMRVEGEDIEAITYTSSAEVITREHGRDSVPAYFVKNNIVPIEYINEKAWLMDDSVIYCFYGEDELEATTTQLIGTSYSVAYEEQKNISYGLHINAAIDNFNNLHFDDFIINVDIKLKDGSNYKKQILVHEGALTTTDIEMKILD